MKELGILVMIGFVLWSVIAPVYRSAHCIELFGHWIPLTAAIANDGWSGLFCR